MTQVEFEGPVLSRNVTHHALLRSQQRHFSPSEIAYVLEYGRLIHKTGICFYFLGSRDVPLADARLGWVQRLVGTTVLVSADDDCVITLYKNREALKDIKRKNKRYVKA